MSFDDSCLQDVTEKITNFVRCRFCKGEDSKSIGKSLEEIYPHLIGQIDLDWLEHLTLEVTNLVQRQFSRGQNPESVGKSLEEKWPHLIGQIEIHWLEQTTDGSFDRQ